MKYGAKMSGLISVLRSGPEVKVAAVVNKTKMPRRQISVYLDILGKRGYQVERVSATEAGQKAKGRGRPKTVAFRLVKEPAQIAA